MHYKTSAIKVYEYIFCYVPLLTSDVVNGNFTFFLNSFADTWHYPSKSDAVSRPSVVDSVFLISLRPNLAESEFSVQFLPNFTKNYRNLFVINSFSLRSLDNTDPYNKNCAQCSSCDIILPILLEQKSLICVVKISVFQNFVL